MTIDQTNVLGGIFRGSNAAASLKRVSALTISLTVGNIFRGSNAAASLKHHRRRLREAAEAIFRGSNAAASLKPSKHENCE